jgi:predicted RNA-binding protein (virulence factor B family)
MPVTPAAFDHLLGRFATLELRRINRSGAFLSEPGLGPDAATLLLLGPEIAKGAREGDLLSAFVYLDSSDRPLATLQAPKLSRGEVAFLRVTALTEFGAFVDWGLPKELLVPFSQQTTQLEVGARHPIGLYLDDSSRLAGTMRVSELLGEPRADIEQDAWVDGEAWRFDPEIGLFAIIERSSVGVVPYAEPQSLSRGQAAKFRVTSILPDGKLELSLRGHAHEQLAGDAERVLGVLSRTSTPLVGDRSSPEQVREVFGLSKKAFKRAVGRLLKDGAVAIDAQGYVRASPGAEKPP